MSQYSSQQVKGSSKSSSAASVFARVYTGIVLLLVRLCVNRYWLLRRYRAIVKVRMVDLHRPWRRLGTGYAVLSQALVNVFDGRIFGGFHCDLVNLTHIDDSGSLYLPAILRFGQC
jgi:hypothetical protein